ncbi:MAG TPA: ATPase, T2SS/T4P/T4SS family [Opitutales bacterium]|jgi:type IV pilus assembly protein PilB|nr:ATPase, T2SS/T4P/T4SS family [Opitutales bacterium]
MATQPGISSVLRKTLLIKVLSKPQPTREDVQSVIELTASKVVEALQAQSMTLYLVEGNDICFKHVYYSPTLWTKEPGREKEFAEKREKLLKLKIPQGGTSMVGRVIETGESSFFGYTKGRSRPMVNLAKDTGFEVKTMVTVPLKGTGKSIGAIQVLNKEPGAPSPEFSEENLALLKEVADYSSPLLQRFLDPKFVISDIDTARFISKYTGNPLVTGEEEIQIDDKLVEVVGDAIIRREGIFPTRRISPTAIAALMTNPLDFQKREAFSRATELTLDEVSVAPTSYIDKLLKRFFKEEKATAPVASEGIAEIADVIGAEFGIDGKSSGEKGGEGEFDDEDSAPVIQLANRIVEDAYVSGASDIHIEPQENELIVRYRVDGVCSEKLRLPKAVSGALSARYKVMADLDIAEKRLPQDGRIVFKKFTKKNIDVDLRVATGPMNFGEKIVMRILDKTKAALPITALGFSEENLKLYRNCIQQPYGMILHCGPTGSGKSMTLFSALREIADPTINIQTAEDPIEYTIPGINQMQMHKQIGLTFARALRAYLRMDPDIVLVGEIRDQETAEIAIEAALTGHLLLSTLHTNDAPSTVARLTDMEVEPFMISASMVCVCAQRLQRRLCKACKIPYEPEGNEKEIMEKAIGWSGKIFKANPEGCPTCGGKGYKGRVGIHELMENSEELTRGINQKMETAELKRIGMRGTMKTLHQDTMLKVKEGLSSILESLTNVPPDMITLEDAKK